MNTEPVHTNLPTNLSDESEFKFSSPNIRLNFIRKVYLILSAQLIFTAGSITYTATNENSVVFFKNSIGLLNVSLVVYLICTYSLFCYRSVARSVPINYILLAICTMAMSFSVCFSVAFAEPMLVLIAGVLTATVVVALTIYAFTTKTDFTLCGGLLFVCGLLFIFGTLLGLLIPGKGYQILMSCLGCVLFGVYLIFDTQLVVGGKNYQLEIDDYVIGALCLYIDIVRLFLEILRLLQLTRN